MTQEIRIVIESLNNVGEVSSKETIMTKSIANPNSIMDLGFRHSEQIEIIKHIQQKLLD